MQPMLQSICAFVCTYVTLAPAQRLLPGVIWSAHAKGTGDAKCRIPFLPLNLMPQIFFYVNVSEQGIDS